MPLPFVACFAMNFALRRLVTANPFANACKVATAIVCLLLTARSAIAQAPVPFPKEVNLVDAFCRQQILVSSGNSDITRSSQYQSTNPGIFTVDATGYITPAGDGKAELIIKAPGGQVRVPVSVQGMTKQREVDFRNEILPILSRHGCNSGGCHGKASGQNGFKLSLFGFDAEFDYDQLVKQARGRRVNAAAPEQSLLLLKAIGKLPHGGGRRIEPDSESYHLIKQWIAGGVHPYSAEAPQVVGLSIEPRQRILPFKGHQQLAVLARYSDGQVRDVTRTSALASNLDVVASVSEDAYVTCGEQSGEATIMARYMGQVAVFSAILPHSQPRTEIPGFATDSYIDRLSAEKWKKLGLLPSPKCDDTTFLRRVTVDLCGRLPTVEEVRAFTADTSSDKRTKAVDRLLNSSDYATFFAMRWGTILRNSSLAGADQASYAFHNWLKEMIARNRPYDEMARGIIAAAGEWQDAPAINWYWQSRDDQLHQVTSDTAQVFLGTRLQCARCHHHPYEKWGQDDYYGLAGFFSRLGRKSFGQPPPYFSSSQVTTGEKNPLTGKAPEPKYLGGTAPTFKAEDDPRHALVDWMAQPDNPFFAKAFVNRMWGHFMGRGLVHEVDDLRETNPASNPELLDALAKDFIDHKFDMKHIIRSIVTSNVYQLSSEPTEHNKHDQQNFARFYARRLISEVVVDAFDQATGTKTRFGGVSSTGRAIDLPHENFGNYFLEAFDRPKRVSGCECERSSSATLAQVLLLANSNETEDKIASEQGIIKRKLDEKLSPTEIIEHLYLGTFSRQPTAVELEKSTKYVDAQENKRQALEDILWTLTNSREFLFNH